MVVSKDNKRRRKETETPPPPPPITAPTATPTSQSTSTAAIESSPEMPKRTKVQAQRKFAQGQSAPTSSTSAAFTAALAAVTSGVGPSTSAESREPPIEILPNRRPKTQDFLTFLCFRGTSTLPAHLDYLNQGNSKETETTTTTATTKKTNNNNNKTINKQNNKKGKRGRPKNVTKSEAAAVKSAKLKNEAVEATAITKTTTTKANASAVGNDKTAMAEHSESNNVAAANDAKQVAIIPGAVRKRAEVVPEGNRRGRRSGGAAPVAVSEPDSKCNSSSHSASEAKRRSNRASTKEGRPMIEPDTDEEEDEVLATKEEAAKKAKIDMDLEQQEKPVLRQAKSETIELHIERKSETPTKDSETGKSTVGKRGRPPTSSINKKAEEVTNSTHFNDTDKTKLLPAKRTRQRESPIFIPSPEPSGRMTRQRAFFEPVKVLPHPENAEEKRITKTTEVVVATVNSEKQEVAAEEEDIDRLEDAVTTTKNQQTSKETKANASIYAKDAKTRMENVNGDKSKSNLNVFDFSSDDEQPLAKSIKLKKGKASPKKATNAAAPMNVRGRKSAAKKSATLETTDAVAKEAETAEEIKPASTTTTPVKNKVEDDLSIKTEPSAAPPENENNTKAKPKRGRGARKKLDDSNTDFEPEPTSAAAKKIATNASTTNARQSRGKSKAVVGKANEEKDSKNRLPSQPASPVRSQRPSRKTKEAAAIYMGIIGHKLQLADDEEDDLSLNSFPDIPNVKEMEKMENEIKKNAAQAQPTTAVTTTSTATMATSNATKATAATIASVEHKPVSTPPTTSTRKYTPSKPAATATAAAASSSSVQSPPNAAAIAIAVTPKTPTVAKAVASSVEPKPVDKPAPRRGRPPKQPKALSLPPKREIEGMLVKKGALAKIATAAVNTQASEMAKTKSEPSKIVDTQDVVGGRNADADEDDDEDFLINEELNETKRKLEKSFSDSDDEPLAIKAHVKGGSEKDTVSSAPTETPVLPPVAVKPERTTPKKPIVGAAVTTPPATTMSTPTQLHMLPLTSKHTPTPPLLQPLTPTGHHLGLATPTQHSTSPLNAQHQLSFTQLSATCTTPSGLTPGNVGLKSMEKKSPIPQSKILNVPAAYALPATIGLGTGSVTPFNKTSPYLPQASPHYHNTLPYIRPAPPPTPTHQFSPTTSTAKSPTTTPTATSSPLKYQTPPTTYPPPIEAYQCPKINPNFLTPKFDRTTLPRSNNFPTPHPSPIKFPTTGLSSLGGSTVVANVSANSTAFSKSIVNSTTANLATQITTTITSANAAPSTSTAAANNASSVVTAGAGLAGQLGMANAANAHRTANSIDPLKDEIASILAANLPNSSEEPSKIFGIASCVTLAETSGPDNTKCTLGKCGSVHKPALGPVVHTEGVGLPVPEPLTSKERRKAKVNMTHEQIQKWLIECSPNPDEIQDDLDDDFDDNLRPNQSTTPPPASNARDDKESTSFSSSSKNTRAELGKSESAWSAKGPSLKATPVVASASRKHHHHQHHQMDEEATHGKHGCDELGDYDKAVNLTQKSMGFSDMLLSTSPSMATAKEQVATDKKTTTADKRAKDVKSHNLDVGNASGSSVGRKQVSKSTVAAHSDKTAAAAASASAGANAGDEMPNSNTTIATKANRNKKNAVTPTTPTTAAAKSSSSASQRNASNNNATTPKRTPVYNQRTTTVTESTARQVNETATTTTTAATKTTTATTKAQKRIHAQQQQKQHESLNAGEKDASATRKPAGNAATAAAATTISPKTTSYRRQAHPDERATEANVRNHSPVSVPNALSERSPTKKRAAAAAAATAVSLTLSPTDNCKLVRVSLDGGQTGKVNKSTRAAAAAAKKAEPQPPPAKVAKTTVKSPTSATASVANDADSDADGATFYIPLQGAGVGGAGSGGIQGVAVKLGREGPDGPNQKVVMQATLVTKAQMGSNTKSDALNTNDLVKTLLNVANVADAASNSGGGNVGKKSTTTPVGASTSAAAAAAAASAVTGTNSASNSLKSVPRHKSMTAEQQQQPPPPPQSSGGANATVNTDLVRVNSCSSLFSGSAKSRGAGPANTNATSAASVAKKFKDDTPIKMANNTAFPRHDDPTQMVEAPIFRPTEKEFADPIEFIERITPIAARFGICKIIPPAAFKPECRISDEMRFTAYNQYVHKMLQRWGPSAKELSAIKKYLATQSIVMNHPPWIGGMEVDLPRLYHTVQELGGLKEVIEKKKWARVAEEMCIPKLAQDRVTKLDDIYCKYLLPYDTLSPAERQKLFDEVEADWAKREARARRNADRFVNTESVSNEEDDASTDEDDESEEEIDGVSMECIVKGRSMPLSQFYRIARNTMALWFKQTEPTVNEVEAEFWRHVAVRDSHVCVHSGSIDSSGWGYGFPSPGPKSKGSNYARHPWNLKVLTNNAGSVLRSLGPVMGVTVPTLHVGMLFSACCWYRDPHGLSWIEYLHTGASKLWYGIPDDQSANFRAALTSLIPTHCQNKTIWLPCDTVMVPPHMLTDRGVSLCRIEQKPGEYIVVFPRAYTSSLATGYVVSESVYFATMSWLDLAKDDFRDIHESCEPAMFSLEQLLFALGYDQRVNSDTLQQMLPMLNDVCEKETAAREQLKAAGVTSTEKAQTEKGGNKAKKQQPSHKSIESECEMCRANLYISMVRTDDDNVYCLQHALKNLNNGNIQAKQCKLIYAFNVDDIQQLIRTLKDKIQQKRSTAIVGKKK